MSQPLPSFYTDELTRALKESAFGVHSYDVLLPMAVQDASQYCQAVARVTLLEGMTIYLRLSIAGYQVRRPRRHSYHHPPTLTLFSFLSLNAPHLSGYSQSRRFYKSRLTAARDRRVARHNASRALPYLRNQAHRSSRRTPPTGSYTSVEINLLRVSSFPATLAVSSIDSLFSYRIPILPYPPFLWSRHTLPCYISFLSINHSPSHQSLPSQSCMLPITCSAVIQRLNRSQPALYYPTRPVTTPKSRSPPTPPRPPFALLLLFLLPIPSCLLPSYGLLQRLHPVYRVRNPLPPVRLSQSINLKTHRLVTVTNRCHFYHDRCCQPRNRLGPSRLPSRQKCVQSHVGWTPLCIVPAVIRHWSRLCKRWSTFPR